MKAIVVSQYGGPEVLKYVDHPKPTPSPNQLLIQVKAIGVNPVDTYKRAGTYANSPKLPFIPGGSDAAGIIVEIGSNLSSSSFRLNQRVFTTGSVSGTYAEYMICESSDVYPLPDNITFEEGAGLWVPYGTAFRAMKIKGAVKNGQIVLVHGASGGVGTGCVQMGKQNGAWVIGTASSEEGRKLVKQLGAEAVFDHRKEGYVEEILALEKVRENGGVDLVIEMLGNVNLEKDLKMVARNGRIVVVGNRGRIEINPRDIMSKECIITGVMLALDSVQEKEETVAFNF
eukprot:TRINITY_DN1556_c0_g2_i1.p1 TRINITY_DN1556_c0_g2~~TRINITY_DN1556_c0_g2_i1.p1  ORF type:complete len:286 (-),score=85.10 TRINITY_DN1556_c0_g2_i1:157-1014(-)